MIDWIIKNKKSIIRSAFLIPVLSVAVISISHVVSWYDLANPMSWAVYLSIAIEVAAMSAIAASSVKVKGFSVWFVFSIVTLIQFIGNIFFSYADIDVNSKAFKDWAELTAPILESIGSDVTDLIAQKRWLALLEGGLLPLISLTCLHFFIQYGEIDNIEKIKSEPISDIEPPLESKEEVIEEVNNGSSDNQIDESDEIVNTLEIEEVELPLFKIEEKSEPTIEPEPVIESETQVEPLENLTPVTDETLGALVNEVNPLSGRPYRVAEISNKMKKIINK